MSENSQSAKLFAAISDIINELIAAYEAKNERNINIVGLKSRISRKHKLSGQPKLVDLIAAIPDQYKAALLPLLRAKPIRTASGIAVVAVMSKPHRCPHIAMTGNIWYAKFHNSVSIVRVVQILILNILRNPTLDMNQLQ